MKRVKSCSALFFLSVLLDFDQYMSAEQIEFNGLTLICMNILVRAIIDDVSSVWIVIEHWTQQCIAMDPIKRYIVEVFEENSTQNGTYTPYRWFTCCSINFFSYSFLLYPFVFYLSHVLLTVFKCLILSDYFLNVFFLIFLWTLIVYCRLA